MSRFYLLFSFYIIHFSLFFEFMLSAYRNIALTTSSMSSLVVVVVYLLLLTVRGEAGCDPWFIKCSLLRYVLFGCWMHYMFINGSPNHCILLGTPDALGCLSIVPSHVLCVYVARCWP